PKVVSQEFVEADHVSVHRHPKSIFEVRRVLLAQLAELQRLPYGGPVPPSGAPTRAPIQLVERLPPTGAATPAARPAGQWPLPPL
ncbi:MAG: hypothetical protein AAF596_02630, partial [Planctomycetota bacterium]